MTYAFLLIVIISLVLTDLTTGVCVNNLSCRAAHAEVYNRGGGLFDSSFSKRVDANTTQCCDAGNPDCRFGTNEDALFWVDCDTDSRAKQGGGQAIVACSSCEISMDDNGLIVVVADNARTKPIAIYACKYSS